MSCQVLTSELLAQAGFVHAFFTRRGGVSEGPYRSLNFSSATGDEPAKVAHNLELAAAALGVLPARVYFLSQVHGVGVLSLDGSEDRAQVLHQRGDAVISRQPSVACGVRIADCVPVLVADLRSGAVAAIQAGWRGTVAGVVEAGIRELSLLAGDPPELRAAIGPHISVAAFEVHEEVAAELAACSSDHEVVDRSIGPRPHVDLRRIVRAKLRALGLAATAIDDVWGCTVGDAHQFFSYRRDGPKSGRHLAAIVPRSAPG
jgi:polyphenol oxidase